MPISVPLPTQPGAFRLLLAMLVFVHHFSSFGFGQYAVYVFFMLSGYWLHAMWVGRYAQAQAPYRTFITSRLWRLAPVMVLATVITVPLLLMIGVSAEQVFASNPVHLALSSTALLFYAWLDYGPVGSAWSLDVEMQFYLLAPLLSLLLLRGKSVALVAVAAVTSLIGAMLVETPTIVSYSIFFAIGMVVAAEDWCPDRRLALASGAVVVVIVLAVTLSPSLRGVLWGGADPGSLYRFNPLFNIGMALLTVPFAMYTVRQRSDGADRMYADLSYIIYLLHWVGMQWFFSLAGRPFAERLEVAVTCFVLVPLVAFAIWKWVDWPINRMRAAWVTAQIQSRRAVAEEVPDPALPGAAAKLEPAAP